MVAVRVELVTVSGALAVVDATGVVEAATVGVVMPMASVTALIALATVSITVVAILGCVVLGGGAVLVLTPGLLVV